ncbi:MAG TPA: FHA domain-containing protein [Reyranella sp.]|nr:FHA domain-containing protein [Reyranella sp.]
MGVEIAALMGFFGLTSAFALVATILAAWMAWRIVEKTGLPGWAGLGAILLTLTGVGSIVPLVLLWVFAFMRWPRDEPGRATLGYGAAPAAGGPARPAPPRALAAPAAALADRRGWKLTGSLPGGAVALAIDASVVGYVLTGAPAAQSGELSVPDPSVGRPHARLMTASGRLGLEDLGTAGGTFIDGARLLPEHGPRDISAARSIRLGTVELALSRA